MIITAFSYDDQKILWFLAFQVYIYININYPWWGNRFNYPWHQILWWSHHLAMCVNCYLIIRKIRKHSWLVVFTILKNMKVNGKDDIPYEMEKTCSKPPTRFRNNTGIHWPVHLEPLNLTGTLGPNKNTRHGILILRPWQFFAGMVWHEPLGGLFGCRASECCTEPLIVSSLAGRLSTHDQSWLWMRQMRHGAFHSSLNMCSNIWSSLFIPNFLDLDFHGTIIDHHWYWPISSQPFPAQSGAHIVCTGPLGKGRWCISFILTQKCTLGSVGSSAKVITPFKPKHQEKTPFSRGTWYLPTRERERYIYMYIYIYIWHLYKYVYIYKYTYDISIYIYIYAVCVFYKYIYIYI